MQLPLGLWQLKGWRFELSISLPVRENVAVHLGSATMALWNGSFQPQRTQRRWPVTGWFQLQNRVLIPDELANHPEGLELEQSASQLACRAACLTFTLVTFVWGSLQVEQCWTSRFLRTTSTGAKLLAIIPRVRADFREGDEDSNFPVVRVRRFTESARASSPNCLSCRNPYQTPHSLNCLPPYHWKALFLTEKCFVASPSQKSAQNERGWWPALFAWFAWPCLGASECACCSKRALMRYFHTYCGYHWHRN